MFGVRNLKSSEEIENALRSLGTCRLSAIVRGGQDAGMRQDLGFVEPGMAFDAMIELVTNFINEYGFTANSGAVIKRKGVSVICYGQVPGVQLDMFFTPVI